MSHRFEIDWVACDGHGLCAGVAPELIDLDEWGYPLLALGDVPGELLSRARQAAASCPALALKVVRAQAQRG
jgi:ferredoxin